MSFAKPRSEYLRIGELAERAGVSVATIKYYIREGLLPPPPVKTGRTMGYYDLAYLDRLKLIRTLREEHYLPLRVIRTILAERGDAQLAPGEAALLARVAPAVVSKLDPVEDGVSREELMTRFKMSADEMELLEEMGLVGEHGAAGGYTHGDVELLEGMAALEAGGLTRDRFPIEGIGHYVELLGELARREVRHFTRHADGLPQDDLVALAERAVHITEPLIALIRRKLVLRAIRAELDKTKEHP